ncbi:MAG: FmdB family zinc ribbon protein [Acidimicrobiales bacterium]
MPIYEYKCTICQERFDVEQSIKDDTLTTIPGDDHEHTVKKVFHPVGIAFKGEGFYKNDTRSNSKQLPPPTTPDSSSSSSSSSSSESSSSSSTSTTSSSSTSSSTTTD